MRILGCDVKLGVAEEEETVNSQDMEEPELESKSRGLRTESREL